MGESDTKSRLVRATRSLMDDAGLEAVTLRAVGAQAGLSRGAPYRHFTDKEDLLAAIAMEDFEAMLADFEKIQHEFPDPDRAVVELLLKFHAFGLSSRVHYQLMFSTSWNKAQYGSLHECGKRSFDQATRMVVNLLEFHGIESSHAPSRTLILFAFIHGLVQLHLAGHQEHAKDPEESRRLFEEFIGLLAK